MTDDDTQTTAFLKQVGQRLAAERKANGMSLESVAAHLGLKSRAAVGHWETGVNPIDLGKLWRLARLYKTTVVSLVAGDISDDDLLALTRRQLAAKPGPAAPAERLRGKRSTARG
jgi:transcriptional regulator with XRE-family HTH domain